MLASRRKTGPSNFFEYFLLISLYLLISTAIEHLYKSGIQDRQNKVWESDSNMLTLLTLSTTFVGPTLEKSYQAASHFCSGMALMLGPNFVGFDLKARRLYPTNMGFNPLDSIPRGMFLVHVSRVGLVCNYDHYTTSVARIQWWFWTWIMFCNVWFCQIGTVHSYVVCTELELSWGWQIPPGCPHTHTLLEISDPEGLVSVLPFYPLFVGNVVDPTTNPCSLRSLSFASLRYSGTSNTIWSWVVNQILLAIPPDGL